MLLLIKKNSWHESWNNFFTDKNLEILDNAVKQIGDVYYPSKENVLLFKNYDFNNIKCVIVGMDPYHSSHIKNEKTIPEATGRSFEVGSLFDKTWADKFKQSSLRNILKAIYYVETGKVESMEKIRKDIKEGTFKIKNPKEWFDTLSNEVLFLNATLTTLPGEAGAHIKYWEPFMNELANFISQKEDVKWLLWGKAAQDRFIPYLGENNNNIITSCHPRLDPFITTSGFDKVKEINWTGY